MKTINALLNSLWHPQLDCVYTNTSHPSRTAIIFLKLYTCFIFLKSNDLKQTKSSSLQPVNWREIMRKVWVVHDSWWSLDFPDKSSWQVLILFDCTLLTRGTVKLYPLLNLFFGLSASISGNCCSISNVIWFPICEMTLCIYKKSFSLVVWRQVQNCIMAQLQS